MLTSYQLGNIKALLSITSQSTQCWKDKIWNYSNKFFKLYWEIWNHSKILVFELKDSELKHGKDSVSFSLSRFSYSLSLFYVCSPFLNLYSLNIWHHFLLLVPNPYYKWLQYSHEQLSKHLLPPPTTPSFSLL